MTECHLSVELRCIIGPEFKSWFCQVSAMRSGVGYRTFQNSLFLLADINFVGITLTPWGSSKVHITWAVCIRHVVYNTCHSNVHFPCTFIPSAGFRELKRNALRSKWNTLNFCSVVDFDFSQTCRPFSTIKKFYILEAFLPSIAKLTLLLCGWIGMWSQYRFCLLMSSQQSELRKWSHLTSLLALPRHLGCLLYSL